MTRRQSILLDELTAAQRALIERVSIAPGELCPCCGRRKPSRPQNIGDGEGAWIPVPRVVWIFDEIVHRIGHEEASRQIPYSRVTLRKLRQGKKPYVRRSTVQKAIVLLRRLRQNNTVYSRRSIRLGVKARGGEPERPRTPRDYYHPGTDEDAERRTALRRQQAEREDQLERLEGY